MKELFVINDTPYSLRRGQQLKLPQTESIYNGWNDVSFKAAILWNNIHLSIKTFNTCSEFKLKPKKHFLDYNYDYVKKM